MTINKETALDLMRRAVEERGEDTVVSACAYVLYEGRAEKAFSEKKEPGCIVGHALYLHGVPFEELEKQNYDTIHVRGDLITKYGIDHDALVTFRVAQYVQDNERPWIEALDAAVNPNEAQLEIAEHDVQHAKNLGMV